MKKLLLIGAMLIVGATSFSARVIELTETGSGTKKWSGEGNMPINSTGTILDATGKAMLVITPVTNAGPDGESMLFDFGSVTRGKELKQIGKFTAEVLTKKGSNIVKADLSKTGTSIEVKLVQGLKSGSRIDKFTVTDPAVELDSVAENTKNKLVDLSYQLSGSNGLTNSGQTYSGEIVATAYRPEKTDTANGGDKYISGRFDDKSVTLQVTVAGVEDIVTGA